METPELEPRAASELSQRISDRSAIVGIIGLGYVGLPLGLAFSAAGYRVLGFDVDGDKVSRLNRGECYISHLDSTHVERELASGRWQATTDFGRLAEADTILICVPTPLTPQRQPDMRFVETATREIRDRLRHGQLVVLESTTYPGTTDELIREILGESGLVCGNDFFLAFSPEREDPGNPDFATSTIPKVVGGVDRLSTDLANQLYTRAVTRTVPVSSARVAEATKLTENIFRAVNIALVNELKLIFERMDVDIWEVLDAAQTKPFGFMRFNPGPGWGGHCIPLDPFYLSWKARENGQATRFIELAGEINTAMPSHVIRKLTDALNERGEAVNGADVIVVGLAYKKDISDPRESPAFEIIDGLLARGANVSYHDPHIPVAPPMRSWPDLPPLRSIDLDEESLRTSAAVVIVTDHTVIDFERIARFAPVVIDTRGVLRGAGRNVVPA
jgi:UDP-N-acetyl-D-glucosamine dehydrogenase